MTPLRLYLLSDIIPEDRNAARSLRTKATHYTLVDEELYRRSFTTPLFKCVDIPEAEYCMLEIHEGICGSHSSGEALAHKVLRYGYYWPTLRQDCLEYAKKCLKRQLYSPLPRQPPVLPSFILSPIPFDTWGIDIMGPFPKARGSLRIIIVAVDYMTKWVEAKAMAHITASACQKFFHDMILTRFGIPRVLITDNGKQFTDAGFEEYLTSYNIQHKKYSVAYPQSNGQVEVTNRSLLRSLKKNLEDSKNLWAEELPNILWAYRTDTRKPTCESPFRLTYGTAALIPVELGQPSLRVQSYEPKLNETGLRANLDLLEEARENVVIRMAQYKQKTAKYFGKVNPRSFKPGDQVLRSSAASDLTHDRKLDPSWEGPYLVHHSTRPGSYHLTHLDG